MAETGPVKCTSGCSGCGRTWCCVDEGKCSNRNLELLAQAVCRMAKHRRIMGNVQFVKKGFQRFPGFDAVVSPFQSPKFIWSLSHREADLLEIECMNRGRSWYHSGHSGNVEVEEVSSPVGDRFEDKGIAVEFKVAANKLSSEGVPMVRNKTKTKRDLEPKMLKSMKRINHEHIYDKNLAKIVNCQDWDLFSFYPQSSRPQYCLARRGREERMSTWSNSNLYNETSVVRIRMWCGTKGCLRASCKGVQVLVCFPRRVEPIENIQERMRQEVDQLFTLVRINRHVEVGLLDVDRPTL